MEDEIDELLIEVRASTQGFASDVAAMRGSLDSTLVEGFRGAGGILERGLLNAIQKGKFGFEDLGRIGLKVIDQIAARALQAGFDKLFGGGQAGNGDGGLGGILGGAFGGLLGLPGRATGGPVSPGRGYLVGERGPEMFVPASAGRVETGGMGGTLGGSRDVRVSINLAAPRGDSAPTALRRSGRQVASAVRRALLN